MCLKSIVRTYSRNQGDPLPRGHILPYGAEGTWLEIERKLRGTDPEKVEIREGRQRAQGTLSEEFCISNESEQNYRILKRLT